MTPVIFEEKYYPAVKETVYQTRLSNGLTVSLLPKKQFNEVYGVVTVRFGSVDTNFTLSKKIYIVCDKRSFIILYKIIFVLIYCWHYYKCCY